jgi:hypothetical protein
MPPESSLQQMLHIAPVTANIYSKMHWTVVRFSGGPELVTSDNPVVKRDPNLKDGINGLGLYNPTIEIVFPLSPTTALVMTHDKILLTELNSFAETGKISEGFKSLASTAPETRFLSGSRHANEMIRTLTIEYAERFVYSPVRDDSIPSTFSGAPRGIRTVLG